MGDIEIGLSGHGVGSFPNQDKVGGWQRVDIRFHLPALSKGETMAYIARHLTAVKAPGEIFTQAAGGVIHEYCEGVLRKVNKVATACLMAAPGQNQRPIDDHLVRVVIESEFEG